jgi:hypothetical protein
MYCLLIRHVHDRETVYAHPLLYETRQQLDRAYDAWRRNYFGTATLTKLQEIKEAS